MTIISKEKVSECFLCNNSVSEYFTYNEPPLGETKFHLGSQQYFRTFDRCDNCGHFLARHNLDLSALYNGEYVDSTYGGLNGMKDRFDRIMTLPPEKSDNVQRVKRVESFCEKRSLVGKRLLDIGAGLGVFPAAMKNRGWSVTAIEPDSRTVKHLINNVAIDAYALDLFDLNMNKIGNFDLVSFNKVLEHIDDPISFLARGSEFLGNNGLMYIELPDAKAAIEGKGREEFFIEHIHIFTPASLKLLTQKANLSVLKLQRLREPSGKFTLACFLSKNISSDVGRI